MCQVLRDQLQARISASPRDNLIYEQLKQKNKNWKALGNIIKKSKTVEKKYILRNINISHTENKRKNE